MEPSHSPSMCILPWAVIKKRGKPGPGCACGFILSYDDG